MNGLISDHRDIIIVGIDSTIIRTIGEINLIDITTIDLTIKDLLTKIVVIQNIVQTNTATETTIFVIAKMVHRERNKKERGDMDRGQIVIGVMTWKKGKFCNDFSSLELFLFVKIFLKKK